MTFCGRHPGHPFLAADPLYALTEDVVTAVADRIPKFFSAPDEAFERDLARTSGAGFFYGQIIGDDVTRIATAPLYQQQRAHGVAFKDRLIAQLPRWAPWASRMPWIFNLRNTLPGAAKLSEAWLGFSAQRSLPAWRSDTFLRDANRSRDDAEANSSVVLFVDTFSNYFEPENAHAATKVLRAAGYSVHVALPVVPMSQNACHVTPPLVSV